MADFLNKILGRLGGYQDESQYDDQYEPDFYEEHPESEEAAVENQTSSRRQQPSRVVDFKPNPGQQQVVIMQPADIESAQQACDHIRAGKTVICNIEKVDPKIAQRVIDFITGATYALDGKVMPVSSVIFVVAPRNIALMEGGIVGQSMDYIRQNTAYAK